MSRMQARVRSDEWRDRSRWTLRWPTAVSWATGAARARMLDLSETGLMLETEIPLALGDEIEVDMPDAVTGCALVVWQEGNYAGCAFRSPIATASVSAALLRAAA
jgi:hypothetical protein